MPESVYAREKLGDDEMGPTNLINTGECCNMQPCWGNLVKALREITVDEKALANEIIKLNC